MRVTRLYVETVLGAGTECELPPSAAAHAVRVLRLRAGEAVALFNGDGRDYRGRLTRIAGSRVEVSIESAIENDRESPLDATLVQALARGERMDFLIQKATELGVRRIVPVQSERSVVRLDEKQAHAKLAHWRAVAISACEQCGRSRLPRIEAPLTLERHLSAPNEAALRLVLDPQAEPLTLDGPIERVEFAIGPEGGFSSSELRALSDAGYRGLRLGPRILRTETAALAALTWLQTQFGDFRRGAREVRAADY